MDLLSDVLRVARLSGGVFLRAQFSAPWCVASQMAPEMCAPFLKPADHLIQYHYIVEGSPRVCIAGRPETAVALRPGEVVILAQNDVHLLGSDLTLRPTPSHELAVARRPSRTLGGRARPSVRTVLARVAVRPRSTRWVRRRRGP